MIINLIPNMPEDWKEGDPAPWRKALGYPWKRLVKKPNDSQYGGSTDFNVSIPGTDIPWNGLDTLKNLLGTIKSQCYSEIVVVDTKSFLNFNVSQFDPDHNKHGRSLLNPDELEIIAEITGMWCGGLAIRVYQGQPKLSLTRQEQETKNLILMYEENVRQGLMLEQKGELLPSAKLKNLAQNYDLVVNEGGEGYNPYSQSMSQEDFDYAKKRLEELQLEATYTNLDVDSPQKKQKSKAKMGM